MKQDIYGRVKGKPCPECGGTEYPHKHSALSKEKPAEYCTDYNCLGCDKPQKNPTKTPEYRCQHTGVRLGEFCDACHRIVREDNFGEPTKLVAQCLCGKPIPPPTEKELEQLKEMFESARNAPMGVSQWMAHGKKYHYDEFFTGKFVKEVEELKTLQVLSPNFGEQGYREMVFKEEVIKLLNENI